MNIWDDRTFVYILFYPCDGNLLFVYIAAILASTV